MKSQDIQRVIGKTTNYSRVGGSMYNGVADKSSSTLVTAQTLDSFTLKGNSLQTVGDVLRLVLSATVTLNATATTQLDAKIGSNVIISLAGIVSKDVTFTITLAVQTAGASGVLKFVAEVQSFTIPLGVPAIVTSLGTISLDLTADQLIALISTTTGTGSTPWATEYLMLADYIPAP